MSRVSMWWGRSSWWWTSAITPNWQAGWLTLRGDTEGPGVPDTFLPTNLHTNRDKLNLLGQFWLSPDRMPTAGSHWYISEPELELTGVMFARTGRMVIGDRPSAKARVTLEQVAYSGGRRLNEARTSTALISIANDANEYHREPYFPYRPLSFPRMYLIVDSERPLNIDLKVKLQLEAEGPSKVGFRHPPGEPQELFALRTPQWEIRSAGPAGF